MSDTPSQHCYPRPWRWIVIAATLAGGHQDLPPFVHRSLTPIAVESATAAKLGRTPVLDRAQFTKSATDSDTVRQTGTAAHAAPEHHVAPHVAPVWMHMLVQPSTMASGTRTDGAGLRWLDSL